MSHPPSNGPAPDLHRDARYERMNNQRKALVLPLTLLVLVSYFTLVLLTNFTSVLDKVVGGTMSLAYIVAYIMFIVVLVVTTVYRSKMNAVDDDDVVAEGAEGGSAH